MRNIRIYLFVGLLAFFPFWSANAALNSYLKLDGASSGPSKATSTGASSGASAGTVTTQPAPPPGGSRDIYLDIKDIEGESAAGPAILEIDTVRGESPENSPPDSTDRLKNSELIDDWPISADAADVRRWDSEKKREFMASVKMEAEVRSEQDLENFAKGILLKDENIKSVEADKEKVKIAYKMPARFLGIFGASITTRAEVAHNGEVKVSLPWYAFLFKKLVSTGDTESEARASLPEVGDEVLVSFESRARAMTTLSNIMKTKHDTIKNSIGNIR